MIRFRFTEDEQRYNNLRAQMYREIAAQLPAASVSRVMRNLGKLEQLLHLEGVRQGLAVAEISALSRDLQDYRVDVREMKAFQAHAIIYGSTDTPLNSVEQEWLQRMLVKETHAASAWLDDSPMRFAPETLEEWEAEQQSKAAPKKPKVEPGLAQLRDTSCDRCGAPQFDTAGGVMCANGHVASAEAGAQELPDWGEVDESEPAEQPALLDRIRGAVQELQQGGHEFSSYHELIMALHLHLKQDAAFLDLQLSSPMGRAVLDQCGLYNLHAGAGMDLSSLPTEGELPDGAVDEPDGDDSGAGEGDGAHPAGEP